MSDADCPICAKHRGEGPLVGPVIFADDLVHVAHRSSGSLGYAFVETRRHVRSLDELTDSEAEAVGRTTVRLARGLCAELDVDLVHTMVAGLAVPHFHQHVFVRHRGMPAELEWWQPWPEAPGGDIPALAEQLADHLLRPS